MNLGESLMAVANLQKIAKPVPVEKPDPKICPGCRTNPREKRKGKDSFYSYCTECLRIKRKEFIAKQKEQQ